MQIRSGIKIALSILKKQKTKDLFDILINFHKVEARPENLSIMKCDFDCMPGIVTIESQEWEFFYFQSFFNIS